MYHCRLPCILYHLFFAKPVAKAAGYKRYEPLGKEDSHDCHDKEYDGHHEHLQDLCRVEHQDYMITIGLVFQCVHWSRAGQIQTMI